MKKVVLLLIMVVGFFSCSNNVEFNDPAMQAKKDGEIWKAISFRANVDQNGRLTITGSSDDSDNLTLRVTSTALATYELGNTVSVATYNDGINTLYSTNNSPDPDFSLYEPDGQIEIYEYDSANKVVSGRYNFNAFDISGFKTINFNQGDFYRVPITGEVIDNACDDATQLVTTTQTVFNSTPPTDANYSTACNAYKNALINKINACGDDNGSLQTIIDSLGDCTVNTNDPCDIATANANAAEIAYNAVLNTDAQYPTVCNDYKNALTIKITQCGDIDGSIQLIIDGLGDCSVVNNACDMATADVVAAEMTYSSTPNTDPQYPMVCNDYKNALMIQITECGDPTGSIQMIIDGLGDCSVVTTDPTGSISVSFGTANIVFDDPITVQQTGTTISVTGTKSANGTTISFDVEQNATGVDIITNFIIGFGAGSYVPSTNPADPVPFTSNITVNNATTINGTFSGTVEPTGAGPDFELTNGIIDIMY